MKCVNLHNRVLFSDPILSVRCSKGKEIETKLKDRGSTTHRVQNYLKFFGRARKHSSIKCQNLPKLMYHTLLITVPWAQLVFPSATPCNEWPTSVGRYSMIFTLRRVRKPAVQLKKLLEQRLFLTFQCSNYFWPQSLAYDSSSSSSLPS